MTVTVRVEPLGVDLAVETGETVMQAAARAGLSWPTVCGGDGQCGVCRMEVLSRAGPEEPFEGLEAEALADGRLARYRQPPLRLACQLRPAADMTVRKGGVRRAGSVAACTSGTEPRTGKIRSYRGSSLPGSLALPKDR